MILKTLVLENFGTYSGVQTLDLEPADGKPVILVGGKNGAGKSTLLGVLSGLVPAQVSAIALP